MVIEFWCFVFRYNFEIFENFGFFYIVYVDVWKRSGWWKFGLEIENCSYGCYVDYVFDVNVMEFYCYVLICVKFSYCFVGYFFYFIDGLVLSDVGIIIFESYVDFLVFDFFRDGSF